MYIDRLLRQRQLSPDGDGGGGQPFVSLEDLDEVTDAEAQKIVDLEKAEAEKKAADDKAASEAEAQRLIDEATEAAKKGTELETSEDKEPKDDDVTDEDESFWADVDKLRGEAIEVEFGDVDPVSPEGVLIYEKAVRADEIEKFENYIKETNPRAYAYMDHILKGGTEEEFFKVAGDALTLPTEAELENSVDLQKDILTRSLKARGNSDKQIERIIAGSIADDDLEEQAKEALKEEAKRQTDGVEALRLQTEQEQTLKAAKIKEMSDYIGEVVKTGKIDNIMIPEKDRAEFAKAFSGSVRIENGKFVTVTEISNDNIAQLMKEKFFSFKNGDLSGLIEKAAATANTKRLQRTITTTQPKPLGRGARQESGLTTMADLDD